MQILLIQHGPDPGEVAANIDPVLARCAGIWSKADYAMPPAGLLSCATVLEQRVPGARCALLDLAHDRLHGEEAQAAMRAVGARVLVHTPGTASLERDLARVAAWQRANPGGWVVALGTHASEEPTSVLRGDRQAVVHGEPELRLSRLVQALAEGADAATLRALPGVSVQLDGQPSRGPADDSLLDVDALPIPDRRWVRGHRYRPPFARPGGFDLVLCSRGCPHGCHYCSTQAFYGRRFRQRAVELVLEEVAQVVREQGVRTVGFWDDTFTIDRKWVLELCEGLRAMPERPGWICMSRVESADTELMRAMADAGCYQVQFGVESASTELMATLGKPGSLDTVRQAFANARAAGMETAGFFMIGLPGETEEVRRATVQLALELDPDYASFNLYTPLPGTPIYRQLKGDRDWSRMDGGHAPDPALERALGMAYLRVYGRPRFVLRQLKGLRDPERALTLARAAWGIARANAGRLRG